MILARRSHVTGEIPLEFYDIAFLVSQFRSLNRRLSKCLMNLPWPYIPNIPSYFYRIYLPSINNMSSILNSNYDSLAFSPIKSTQNSTNRYENEFFSDHFNSNSIENHFLLPSNQPTNIWSNPQVRSNLFSLQETLLSFRVHRIFLIVIRIWEELIIDHRMI